MNCRILILGDSRSGKTEYVNALCNIRSERKYTSTNGINIKCLVVDSNIGEIFVNIWDVSVPIRNYHKLVCDECEIGAIIVGDATGDEYKMAKEVKIKHIIKCINIISESHRYFDTGKSYYINTTKKYNILVPFYKLLQKMYPEIERVRVVRSPKADIFCDVVAYNEQLHGEY